MPDLSTLVARFNTDTVDLDLFKSFVRQDHADDDALLTVLRDAALLEAEQYLQRAITPQSRVLHITGTPPLLVPLDFGPVYDVTAVKYTPPGGVEATLDAADYVFVESASVVTPVNGWPVVSQDYPGLFVVEYSTGPEPNTSPPTALPADIVSAVLLLAQFLYGRKDGDILRTAAFRMLDPYRKGQGV